MGRRSGSGSIVHDVKVCLKEVDRIGQSKRDAREAGVVGIHSLKQKEHTLSACQNFVKWTRDAHGVRKAHELTQEHYKAYIGHLEQQGRSAGHRQNVETALKHLQRGLNVRSERFRHFDVPKPFERELERMLQGKGPEDRLVPVQVDTIRQAVSKGLKTAGIEQNRRGCHGFRHAYARERIDTLFRERGLGDTGHVMMQRALENRQEGKPTDYGILTAADRRLYAEVREVMDRVHAEIGHGANRWDLAMRYMKD